MQTTDDEYVASKDHTQRAVMPWAVLVLLQATRSISCIVFNYWLWIRGLPGRPPGLDIMVYIPPIFFALGILDIILVALLSRAKEYRAAYYSIVLWDIILAFAPVWFPVGPLFVYDWLLSTLAMAVCVLSLLHLALLFWWMLRTYTD